MNKTTLQEEQIDPSEKLKAPSILRTILVLLLFILVGCILVFGRDVLIPVMFSILLAMLMTPLSDILEKRINRVFSTLICLFIVMIVIAGIFFLVGKQFEALGEDLPKIQEKATLYLAKAQGFIGYKFDVSPEQQKEAIKNISKSLMQSGGSSAKNALAGFTGVLGNFVIVFIFTFLFMFQREKYHRFFLKLFKRSDLEQTENILKKISKVAQQYLTGRLLSILFLFILYSVGFLIAGTKHALLLSFVAALLTIVPYVGSIVGGILPFLMTLVTEDSTNPAFIVLGVIIFVQAVDNYFIEPNVVGGEVNLSAFSTILILIVGGYIWGVAGMILFIPMLGIAKIVFDHVHGLEPYGYLIGDQKKGSPSGKIMEKIKKLFKRK